MNSKKFTKTAIILTCAVLAITICVIVIWGMSSNRTGFSAKEGVAPYELTENERNLLQYFSLDGNSQIITYNAPADAISLKINVYRLNNGSWEPTGGGAISIGEDQPVEQLDGIFTMTLENNYAIDFNIISGGGEASYTSDEIFMDDEIISSTKGFLTDFQGIEQNKEIPVAIMVYDSGTSMRSYGLHDFFEPSNFEGMDLVQAVTLVFT